MSSEEYPTEPTEQDLKWAQKRLRESVRCVSEDDYRSTWRGAALNAAETALIFARAESEDDALLIRRARAMSQALWSRDDGPLRPPREWF